MIAIFCPECGSENENEAKFCLKCGAQINLDDDNNAHRNALRRENPLYEIFSSGGASGIVIGAIIVFIGVMFSLGDDFASMMGNWGESFGRFFADNVGTSIGASMAIVIGFIIVASSLYGKTRG